VEFNWTRLPAVTKAVFVAFAVLVPILLINMLIAMMANTYEQIIRRAEKEWKRQVPAALTTFMITRPPPVEAAPTRCAKPATPVCLPCNDHAQPAADKAPTSVTDILVVLIVV